MATGPLAWRGRTFELEARWTLVMGILNVTPDSFSEAGEHYDEAAAIARGLEVAEQGADLLDVGGESTARGPRP